MNETRESKWASAYRGAPDPKLLRTSQALFAWVQGHEARGASGLLLTLYQWAEDQGYPARLAHWTPEQVAAAHAEAKRIVATLATQTPGD